MQICIESDELSRSLDNPETGALLVRVPVPASLLTGPSRAPKIGKNVFQVLGDFWMRSFSDRIASSCLLEVEIERQ